jgi:hypothetical protein
MSSIDFDSEPQFARVSFNELTFETGIGLNLSLPPLDLSALGLDNDISLEMTSAGHHLQSPLEDSTMMMMMANCSDEFHNNSSQEHPNLNVDYTMLGFPTEHSTNFDASQIISDVEMHLKMQMGDSDLGY